MPAALMLIFLGSVLVRRPLTGVVLHRLVGGPRDWRRHAPLLRISTNLLAARPEIGRTRDTPQISVIRALSRWGILLGTVETALLPALLAVTPRRAVGGCTGAAGGHLGAAAEQALYRPLRSAEDAARVWRVSEELTKVAFTPV